MAVLKYDPSEPTVSEVKYSGYNVAKWLCMYSFIKRAERMLREGWLIAAICYEHFCSTHKWPVEGELSLVKLF
jgi:hypothetical protein